MIGDGAELASKKRPRVWIRRDLAAQTWRRAAQLIFYFAVGLWTLLRDPDVKKD